ncbi:sulfotransferase family protein [Sciscionella marina]|uniref:sulfotransferase family protein n=1 Tax=Sciscionella marina TaxID=508770 RepID=UPI000373FD65|nr:sulfotransferase [Sciscionella marina]
MAERENVGTVEDLHASATKITGLEDFGGTEHHEALEVLLDSYHSQARLTPFGRRVKRAELRGGLVARALSEAALARGAATQPVHRPIFVTGLPRSGTTALHRLLTVDPAHQGLELWLTEVPQPRPPRAEWENDPVFAGIQEGYSRHHIEHPEFMGVHYISADAVEECWRLLRQSIMSVSYECLAHIPGYSAWLREQDWTPAYRRHRRNLELIGGNDPGKRWVLKNPSHLFAIDALLAVYPDALIVQTHRDPRTAIASACSLAVQASSEWSEAFDPETVGRDQLELWATGLERCRAACARYDQSRFYDVDYADFIADPVGTAESVYRHFGIELTEEASAAMRRTHAESVSGKAKPAHRYTLGDFGLAEAAVDERFAGMMG